MSTKVPKVAAIISAYFCEEFLNGRIENLLEQGLKEDLQIVIVAEMKSKEAKIAREWQKKDVVKDFFIVDTDGVPTVYDAWNMGIKVSDSEYITNANSDDRHKPGCLKVLAGTLDDHPEYAMSYSDIEQVKALDAEPIGVFKWMEGGLKELLAGCFLGPMPMWRRSVHEKYGMFDPEFHSAGDYEFWLRLAAGKEKFYHVKTVLGTHLERSEGVEHRSPVRSTWETARARGKYRAILKE